MDRSLRTCDTYREAQTIVRAVAAQLGSCFGGWYKAKRVEPASSRFYDVFTIAYKPHLLWGFARPFGRAEIHADLRSTHFQIGFSAPHSMTNGTLKMEIALDTVVRDLPHNPSPDIFLLTQDSLDAKRIVGSREYLGSLSHLYTWGTPRDHTVN